MSRIVSLLHSIRPLQCQRSLFKHNAWKRVEQSLKTATGANFKTIRRHKSSAAENQKPRQYLFETRCSARNRLSSEKKKARLVIFDKDGTLICFHTMWSQWTVKIVESIASKVGLDVQDKLYKELGVCAKTKRVFPGLLAEMTTPIIQDALTDLLVKEGVDESVAREAITSSWIEGDSGEEAEVVESVHPDLRTLFKILKANDIKIAVCTADNRHGTLNTLKNLGLEQFVDMVVCGNDPDNVAKPAPDNAWRICKELGVDPADTVMVGDTKADMGMGHAAKLGWVVGVLTGVGDTEELVPKAHYVIDNVKDLLPLIMPYDDWVNYYSYSSHERVLREPFQLAPIPDGVKIETINMATYDVVIFDLHGTLVCSNHKYIDWLEKLATRLEQITGLNLAPLVYQYLGVSSESKRVTAGLLEQGAQTKLKEALVKLLRKEGFHFEEAIITVNQAWSECETAAKSADIVPLDKDTRTLFKTLKQNKVKIAINTSTTRETAINDLKALGLMSYVDMMVCGDDPMSCLKPDAYNALLICEEMGTKPERAVVVGDTMEDIGMGLNAKVGLTIGVLTGVGSHTELVQADHIVPSVRDILRHLRSDGEDSATSPSSSSSSSSSSSPSSASSLTSNNDISKSGRRMFSTGRNQYFSGSITTTRSFSTSGCLAKNLIGTKSKYDYWVCGLCVGQPSDRGWEF